MDSVVIEQLVARARDGDSRALSELFQLHQPRLVRMVELRLDAALRRRLDPADVVQEAWLEVVRRFEEWCAQDALPLSVWLRLTTAQALAQAQRRHLGAQMRDAEREVGTHSRASISAIGIAHAFLASQTSPTQAARREELRARVLAALEDLDELDREIVALRHFEGLSNDEAALELAITPAAASKRFVRALVRLRPALESLAAESAGERA
ncbi:MAG: sigma-70 family RNA polymerase sigma factor [Planctomycetota bacterium]